jgi:uncharacterized RDD family membrane protein YckC
MFEYPDPTGPGPVATYGNMPQNTARPEPWRRGYMADAKLASWPWRMASGAIDYLPLWLIFDFFSRVARTAVAGFVLIAVLCFINNGYMQGITGQSLGKRLVGTRLVSAVETGPWEFAFVYPGVGRCLGRQLAHFFDSVAFYIGFIRPLWQREHKTWADSIAKTVVLDRSAVGFEIRERQQGEQTTRNL